MAKTFEVKTMNGSRVTPKIAGIESTANTTSVTSTTTRTRSSGVASRRPSMRVKNLSPSYAPDNGTKRRNSRTTGFFSRSGSMSPCRTIRIAV